ncbi:hypothetical protein KVR01_002430 [Diaporthe batatas]|uniref:uncharacterized protein n=1 Tax=Diaporthe batatas TaxID=748121 RepID=UPI001D045E8C|nr:uncharacterized protein KVR01_002430 [Diaporthe batatas]KAG8166741.1 hypothetical protein KVR01_002430 [Diaporthe batatas]
MSRQEKGGRRPRRSLEQQIEPAQDDNYSPAIKPQATQPDATSQQPKVPNNTALRAKAPSRKTGTAVPIGPSKQRQAQKKTAGKTTKDGIHHTPNSSSTEQKRKARAEPHTATTTSKEDTTEPKLPVAAQPSAKGAPAKGPGPSDQPATTRKRRAASAPVEGGGRASKRSRLQDEGDTDWRAAPIVFAQRHQDRDDGAMDVDTAAVLAEAGGGDAHADKESGGVCEGGADDGKQLAASESPPGIELTGGYGAFMGFALGAGAFALRHWS